MSSPSTPKPPDVPSPVTEDTTRAAFTLLRAGDARQLGALLDAGLPLASRNERGDSLLMLASYLGHLEATRLLLARGADPEQANASGQTPLAGAAFKGGTDIARALLDAGAKVDGAGPDGKTPLMFAAMFDKLEMVELLLQRGANPAQRDADRKSALDHARTMGAWRAATRLEPSQQS
jgi:uncharacterized protein